MSTDFSAEKKCGERRDLLMRGIGKRLGGDLADSGYGRDFQVRMFEEWQKYRHGRASRRSKLAKRFDRQPTGGVSRVIEEIGERRHNQLGFDVEVAQGVGGALPIEMVGMLEGAKQDRYGWLCIGAEVGHGEDCGCGDSEVPVCDVFHQHRQGGRANVSKRLACEGCEELICADENAGECRNCRCAQWAEDFKRVDCRRLNVDVVLGEHFDEMRDGVGSDGANGFTGVSLIGAFRFGVCVELEPLTERLGLVSGFCAPSEYRGEHRHGPREKNGESWQLRHGGILA